MTAPEISASSKEESLAFISFMEITIEHRG